jgi:hypothetical protein
MRERREELIDLYEREVAVEMPEVSRCSGWIASFVSL